MKIYQVTIIILCFNIALTLLNYSNVFGRQYISADNSFSEELNNRVNAQYTQTQVGQQSGGLFGFVTDTIFAVTFFIETFTYTTVVPGYIIAKILGGSQDAFLLGVLISIPIYLIYAVSLMQFVQKVRVED